METSVKAQGTSVDELMEIERESCRRWKAGDIDGMMDQLLENARVCPPDSESIVGRENQRVLFAQLAQTEGVELSWEPIEAFVSASDDMGYVYGSVKWKMPNVPEKQGKYVTVWIRVNGEWKNLVEIRNSNG